MSKQSDEDAVDSYDNALIFDPNNIDLLKNHGILLNKLRYYARSIDLFDKALTLGSNNIDILIYRGDSLSKINRILEAVDSYDKALSLNPNNAIVWEKRGWILRKLGRFEEAVLSFEKNEIILQKEAEILQKEAELNRELRQGLHHLLRLEMKKKSVEIKRTCIYCGKEFLTSAKYRKKYCSECAVNKNPEDSCQKILKTHHEELQDDPDRLSTEFIVNLVGCECKARISKKKSDDFEIAHSLLEY